MKRILFLTTNNLTTNPRILKEMKLAQAKYEVYFIGFEFYNWSQTIEEQIKNELEGIQFKYIPISHNNINWVIASFINICCAFLNKLLPDNLKLNAYASDKRSFLLYQALKKIKLKYDLVIAHNLGALYPAYSFALKKKIPFAFDMEDYHPGELILKNEREEKKRREALLKKILPFAEYVSFASPLILQETINKLVKPDNYFFISNSFDDDEFLPSETTGKVRFVWFSQYITGGRGLELFIPILNEFKDKLDLTLIGQEKPEFTDKYRGSYKFINFHTPVAQRKLHNLLARFDVGLAIENDETDLNKKLAESNKLYAYAQAGLFILATDTLAQKMFLQNNNGMGVVTSKNEEDINAKVHYILNNIDKIRCDRNIRFKMAESLSFKVNEKLLKSQWEKTIL